MVECPRGDVVLIGTGLPEVVVCASAGWSDATVGGDGVLGGFGSVGFQKWCVGHDSPGLDLRARFGLGGWGALGLGGWDW